MKFDYEQSIWGRGTATLRASDPTAIRLRAAIKALNNFGDNAKILEFGCGAGQFIRAIKKSRPELDCYGSDISEAAIKIARSINDAVVYEVALPERTIFNEATFDAVLIFDVLEHVENPGRILSEIFRILKPGGKLYAFVPCEGDWLSFWRWLDIFGLKKDLTRKFAGHIQYFSRENLFSLFEQNGFAIRSKRYSEHFFGQIVGVAAFLGMARASKNLPVGEQLNNEDFFEGKKSSWYKIFAKFANTIIYLESWLFSFLPSPNVHIVAEKPALVSSVEEKRKAPKIRSLAPQFNRDIT